MYTQGMNNKPPVRNLKYFEHKEMYYRRAGTDKLLLKPYGFFYGKDRQPFHSFDSIDVNVKESIL